MKNRGSLKFRTIADFVPACALGIAAPTILAPIGGNRRILFTSWGIFLLAARSLFDGLRILQRLRKSYSNESTAAQ